MMKRISNKATCGLAFGLFFGFPALEWAQQITVVAPADSDWPRNPSKIVPNAPSDFTVDSDGRDRYVMVQVINGGSSDPKADFSKEPTPNGGRINLGACGNTSEASKSMKN